MKQRRWIILAAALLIALAFAVGTEYILDRTADSTTRTETQDVIVNLFPAENVSLVNCELQDGYLIPANNDPQMIIGLSESKRIGNVTIRFSQPLEESFLIQLFYDTGRGYSEEQSIVIPAGEGDNQATIPLEKGNYYSIRIDINGRAALDSIDCDGEVITVQAAAGEFRIRRAVCFFVIFFILFAAAALCIADPAWRNAGKTAGEVLGSDAVRYAVISVVVNIFLSMYYHFGEMHELKDVIKAALHPNWPGIILLFVLMYGGTYIAKKCNFDLFGFLHKWRWAIAGAVLVVGVLLQINGSSLHLWNNLLDEYDQNGVIFGVSRTIRADEWAREIPMVKALSYENFPMYSNILRAAPTETVVTTGKITWDFSAVFHPFVWGYLTLGFTYGLSYSWCLRYILLFMVSYDLFMLVSKNRKISVAFAFTVVFAPFVQWWFTTSITELLVSSFGLILVGRKYLLSDSVKEKIWLAVLVFILAGNFALTLYPAWMVPLAYLMVGLLIWVIIVNRKQIRMRVKVDIPIIGITVLLFAASMAIIYLRSADAIHDMTNTVYPGTTRTNWALSPHFLYSNLLDVMSPFTNEFDRGTNVCESAGMFTLFPVGILLSIYAMIRRKKADSFSIIMLILSGFFALFTFIDMPLIIRKLTLMELTMSSRLYPCFALVQSILLFRAVSMLQEIKRIRWYIALPVSVLAAVFINWQIRKISHIAGYEAIYIGILLLSVLMIYAAVQTGKSQTGRNLFATVMVFVSLFAGGLVNPVRVGTDELDKSALLKEINDIVRQDEDGKWLVENLNYPYAMLPLMGGAPTINCANNYPDLERWYLLDPEHDDEYYYNRFTVQITTNLVEEEKSTFLSGDTADQFRLYLDIDDMNKLEISYIFSNQELEEFSTESVHIEKIYTKGLFKIYHVTYTGT